MKLHSVFNTPLGLSSPFGVTQKNELAAGTIAAIAGGASLVSGALNLINQADTNRANRQIAADNRQWQSSENRASEAWQEKMWNLTNQYNTPSAMKARVNDAGYNPYLFDGSKLAGTAGSASVPSTPAKQGAPDMPVQQPLDASFVGQAGLSFASTYAQQQGVAAQSANQMSQSHLNDARAVEAIFHALGKEAATAYARKIGFSNGVDDSPMVKRMDLDLERMDLENTSVSLKNHLVRKYGDKESESRIANLEQLTTKYVGELGLMSARADLSRSEIQLNEKKAYALGAQCARDLAQARLFGSEAAINEGICQYVIKSAEYKAGMDSIDYNTSMIGYNESYADFVNRTGIRQFKMSPEGQSRAQWNYQMSPEGNYVTSFLCGFTNATGLRFNGNVNLSRSWNTSGSVNTTNVFSYTPYK